MFAWMTDDPRDTLIDLDHRLTALETDLGRLADSHRDLHDKMASLLDLLETRLEGEELALAPLPPSDDEGPRAFARRVFRVAKKRVKGWLGDDAKKSDRFTRSRTDLPVPPPTLSVLAADRATALALASRQTVSKAEWAWWDRAHGQVEVVASGDRDGRRPAADPDAVLAVLGGRVCARVPAVSSLPSTALEDALLVLAIEELDLIELLLPDTSILLVRRDLWHASHDLHTGALASRVVDQPPVVGRRLSIGGARLHPTTPEGLRVTADGILLTSKTRPGTHKWPLRAMPPVPPPDQGVLIRLDTPPIGGIDSLLAELIAVAGDRPVTVATHFQNDSASCPRLLALEALTPRIHHLHELIPDDLRAPVLQRLSVGRTVVRLGVTADADLDLRATRGAIGGVVPWGIEPRDVDRVAVTEIRARLGIDDDTMLVVHAADLIASERPEDVVAVAHRLGDAPIHVLMVGDGPLAGPVDDLARWMKPPSLRRLAAPPPPGWLTLLAAADVVLSTAERVVWPTTLLDALSVGTPVVATDVAGLDTLLLGDTQHEDEEREPCGVLAPVGDVDALAGALHELVDPERRQRLAAAARLAAHRHPIETSRNALADLLA